MIGALLSVLLATAPACHANPLGTRALYVRGDFNSWAALDEAALRWSCDHFEGVVAIEGKTRFKLGDEGWSLDADFGADPAQPDAPRLAPKGREIEHRDVGPDGARLKLADVEQPVEQPRHGVDGQVLLPQHFEEFRILDHAA